MVQPSPQSIVRALNEVYGKTFAERLGIDVQSGSPEALFKILVASFLFSMGIDSRIMENTYNLFDVRGWTDPERLTRTTFNDRLAMLDEAGYLRDDKNVASMIAELPVIVEERYNGDLNSLRERAGRVPEKERRLIEEFRGIDDVGADFLFQEIQNVWDESYPFAGELALRGARKLGFDPDTVLLAKMVKREDFPRFVSSLMQMEQENDHSRIFDKARRVEQLVEA